MIAVTLIVSVVIIGTWFVLTVIPDSLRSQVEEQRKTNALSERTARIMESE